MKTTNIIRDERETTKQFLTGMYESICKQKEMLELILDVYNTEQEEQTLEAEEPRELIKGVKGLAEFLGCGTTKAQDIMNSGVLQERDIAYRAGNRWRFNKNLLSRFLGYVVYGNCLRLNRRSKLRFENKMNELSGRLRCGDIEEKEYVIRASSLMSFINKASTGGFRRHVSAKQGMYLQGL